MANGKTHRAMTVIASIGLSAACMGTKMPVDVTVPAVIGCLIGVFVHPDLDQSEKHSGAWALLWKPYGYAIKHRSFWSHAPIIGTVLRTIYLGAILYGLFWLLEPRFNLHLPWSINWLYATIGLMLSDVLHIVVDVITSWEK